MKKYIIGIFSLIMSLNAKELLCHDIYTSITSKKGDKYITEGAKGNGKTKLKITFDDKKVFLTVGSDKQNLFWIGKGTGASYMVEKTDSGNINLYTLFKDNTLTVSKSYDFLGIAKVNAQTIYKCRVKKENEKPDLKLKLQAMRACQTMYGHKNCDYALTTREMKSIIKECYEFFPDPLGRREHCGANR